MGHNTINTILSLNAKEIKNMKSRVNFISTVLAKYNALAVKDENTLYFLEDAKRIFKGEVDVTEAVKVVDLFADVPGADIVEGKIYIHATTFETRIKNGDAWVTMLPGYISAAEGFNDTNADKLATIGATKAYITAQIAEITGGTAFVKDVTWENGTLNVDTGDTTPAKVELTGVAHDVSYDLAALKLSIPVYGKEDIVVNIPKDNFVRSGRYEQDYDLGDGSTGPAIVLVVATADAEEATKEVVIPAASLVDTYTGTNSNTVKVTVSEDHQITASVVIDPKAGNALVQTAAGLSVDISGKADKLTADANGHILISAADGNLADSSLTLKASGEMGDLPTEVPTAALIAAAITAAVNAAQQTVLDKIAEITNEEATGRLDVLEQKVENLSTSVLGEGNPDEVVISTESGIARSGKKIGGSTLSETPDASTVATEAAVLDAVAWKSIE